MSVTSDEISGMIDELMKNDLLCIIGHLIVANWKIDSENNVLSIGYGAFTIKIEVKDTDSIYDMKNRVLQEIFSLSGFGEKEVYKV